MATPDDVVELIEQSGNNFHAKVARWFANQGWHVIVSPYYMDQSQGKAREIDLIVEKICGKITEYRDEAIGDVVVRLFVECKYFPLATALWFADKDREQSLELVCGSAGFRRGNFYTEKHHYLATSFKVAKLFASNKDRYTENEPIYRALNQTINALVSMRGRPVSIPAVKKQAAGPLEVLEFPIVVCNSFDNLFGVDFYADSSPVALSENFQFEIKYAYLDQGQNQQDEYFLIDFVEFKKLEEFVDVVVEDARVAAFLASKT